MCSRIADSAQQLPWRGVAASDLKCRASCPVSGRVTAAATAAVVDRLTFNTHILTTETDYDRL